MTEDQNGAVACWRGAPQRRRTRPVIGIGIVRVVAVLLVPAIRFDR